MVKLKISREDLDKMLKDQLRVKEVKWGKDGSAEVEMDLEQIKKTQVVERPYWYPIYVEKPVNRPYYPYWTASSSSGTLSFCISSSQTSSV